MSKIYSIGREDARQANILIDNSTISGLHANIWFDESSGNFWIEDTRSRNGTFIIREGSKKKVKSPSKVYASDIVVLGKKQVPFSDFLESVNDKGKQGHDNKSDSGRSVINMERCLNCMSPKVIGQECTKC